MAPISFGTRALLLNKTKRLGNYRDHVPGRMQNGPSEVDHTPQRTYARIHTTLPMHIYKK